MFRYGAKALRARLSKLSFADLLTEAIAADDYLKARQEQSSQILKLAVRYEREETEVALSQRQAEFAKRPRVKAAIVDAIVAAARHYRNQQVNAGEAWDALCKTPFRTEDGYIVKIEGSELSRPEQRLCVISPDGTQPKRPIGFDQWRKRYWAAAA
jgi:hypothetical protein